MLTALLVLFVAVAIGVFAFTAAYDQKNARARVLRERLESVQQAARRSDMGDELTLLRDELLSEIPALHRLLQHSARIPKFQLFLSQAGLKIRPGKFLLLMATCGLAVALLASLVLPTTLVLIAFVIAALVPFGIVSFWRARRFQRFERQFPDAIDLLARAVRAGHAFTTSLEFMSTEMPEPISGEFRKLFEEQRFGLPLREALLNLAERIPLVDVKFFITAVLLQRDTGGNLTEILDKLSYVIRERFKLLRQVKTYTAQGRLTCGILMVVPPAIAVVMNAINPAFMKPLYNDPVGHFFLATAIVLQILGFLIIRRIIHIQV
jgi:tight adherence protein B